VKTIRALEEEKKRRFAKQQETCRKDVDPTFGVPRWAIVHHPARTWSVETTWKVMTACVIMYNMKFGDERNNNLHDQWWQF
jgi:hypothetical protein